MNETVESIIQWHKETFPETNKEEQFEKFLKEYAEFLIAYTQKEKMLELADMYIVCCGIHRFGKSFELFSKAMDNVNDGILILSGLNQVYNSDNIYDELQKAVNEKMAINRKRAWHKVNGEWRHK